MCQVLLSVFYYVLFAVGRSEQVPFASKKFDCDSGHAGLRDGDMHVYTFTVKGSWGSSSIVGTDFVEIRTFGAIFACILQLLSLQLHLVSLQLPSVLCIYLDSMVGSVICRTCLQDQNAYFHLTKGV